MTAYFALLSVPALAAMAGIWRGRVMLVIVALLYWFTIGFRFNVGVDWTNYIHIFEGRFGLGAGSSFLDAITDREPGFALLSWIAAETGGDIYLINAVSAFVFCWGFFAFAKRCPEPFLAVVAATPLVAIAMAMNLTRQSVAFGIIAYLFANWERRGSLARIAYVLMAATFHFSALFVLVFVALAARATAFARYSAAALMLTIIAVIIALAPSAWEAYSRLYISGRVQAAGAIFHVAVLSFAGLLYLLLESRRIEESEENLLFRNLAITALASIPLSLISSVAAYRFSLYLWPVAMYSFGSLPSLIPRPEGRLLCRLLIIVGSVGLLWVWLSYANNGQAWIPYRNWLLE